MNSQGAIVSMLGRTLKRRRIRLWGATVAVIVGLMVVEALVPEARTFTRFSGEQSALVMLAVFGAALCCEFVDSALGMGYGTTLTPLLLIAGFSPLQVVPCILLSEFVTGLAAGVMHQRDGNVDFFRDSRARKTAFMLSVLSAVGATGAVLIAVRIPTIWLSGIIGVMILSVGVTILATIRRQLRYRASHIVLVGGVAAFNKGLSGGGYGPLVTAGQVVSGLSPKQAVAITSLSESFACAVGLIAYVVLRHGRLDFSLALPLLMGAVLSVPLATLAVHGFPERSMRKTVGIVTSLLGVLTLCKVLFG